MAADRYVLLGLGRPRAEWFRLVGRWATAASLPAEFVKCVSAEELRARLRSGRPFSAALLDGNLPQVDRDLVDAVREAGCAPLVVDDGRAARDWRALGAVAVLPEQLTREQLLEALAANAVMVGGALAPVDPQAGGDVARLAPAPVAAVVGPGGTGSSTVAIALAQGLAARSEHSPVLLADLCRHAEQAMLHDAGDVFPGLQELVDAHRAGRPAAREIRASTFAIEARGYHLLLGLRRHQHWTMIRPRAFEAAFANLRQAFRAVVCDIDADFEGEDQVGSVDVEERNLLSRTALLQAAVVVVVGRPGMKGLHSLVRLVGEVTAAGVDPAAVVPVVNAAPRQPRQRAAMTADFASLGSAITGARDLASPVFLPRRKIDEALQDGVALPAPLPELLVGAYLAALERGAATAASLLPEVAVPQRVAPGSLGTLGEGSEP